MVSNNTSVELASVSVSHPLWFVLILAVQCKSVFSTLTTSLSPSANPFFSLLTLICIAPHQGQQYSSVFPSPTKCFPLTQPWLLVTTTTKLLLFSLCISFFLPVLHSLFFLFLPLSFVPDKMYGSWRDPSHSLWNVHDPSYQQMKATVDRQMCHLHVKKTPAEAWLIVLTDVLRARDAPSVHDVANCNYDSNSMTSYHRWCICCTNTQPGA